MEIEQQQLEPAPVDAPSQLTPPPQDDFERLLADYEANTTKPEPDPATTDPGANNDVQTTSELDALLERYSTPDPRISELEGELAGMRSEAEQLRAEQHRAKEWEAFQDFSKSLQEQLPPHLPDGYAELKLKALAHDPQVAMAFDYRNVDRQAASAELARAQLVLAAFQRANDSRIPQLQEYMNKLNIALNSQSILRKARLDIINEANKLPPPIDPDATQIRNDVAWAMKSARGKIGAEPPTRWGQLTANEGNRKIMDDFGFHPGWKD